MNKRNVWIAVFAVALIGAGIAFWLLRPASTVDSTSPSPDPSSDTVTELDVKSETVHLYFPSGELLYAEAYEIPATGSLEQRMLATLEGLRAGPRSAKLKGPLPTGVRIGAVFLLDRTAYIDLVSEAGAPIPASGSQREMLTAYSLVQTLVTNFSEVEAVVLLLNGRQPATLAGHLDTTRPLRPDPRWIAR